MSQSDIPRPPAGTKAAGRRLWAAVLAEFEFEEHEMTLFRQVVRIADRLDALNAVVARDGELVTSAGGDVRAHPALVESRQQAIALARLWAALRVPSGDEDAGRPQKRAGVRGVYGVGGGPARLRRVA